MHKKFWSTHTGEAICVKGVFNVKVEVNREKAMFTPLGHGRQWTESSWERLTTETLTQLVKDSCSTLHLSKSATRDIGQVFKNELGQIKNAKAKIFLDAEVKPRFFHPRPIPYAFHQKVEAELNHLEQAGVIEPVQLSDWAVPIVPDIKKDG